MDINMGIGNIISSSFCNALFGIWTHIKNTMQAMMTINNILYDQFKVPGQTKMKNKSKRVGIF